MDSGASRNPPSRFTPNTDITNATGPGSTGHGPHGGYFLANQMVPGPITAEPEQIPNHNPGNFVPINPGSRRQTRFNTISPTPTLVGGSGTWPSESSRLMPKGSSDVEAAYFPDAWQKSPQPLKRHTWTSIMFGIGDTIMAIAPIIFIVMAALVAKLHNQPTQNNRLGKNMEQFVDLGPTIFPILFAAVVGRSLKAIARYRAEKGTTLGTLELLMASQTVWGTFESQVLLKYFSILGVNLLFLWALSPIGGQASLRILEFGNRTITNSSTSIYLPTGGMSERQFTSGPLNTANDVKPMQAIESLYRASLLVPNEAKGKPVDTWGNVRIPWLETLDSNTTDKDGWMAVPPQLRSFDQYSALIGLPIAGIPKTPESELEVSSAYMKLDCPDKAEDIPRNDRRLENGTAISSWTTLQSRLGILWGLNGTFTKSSTIFGTQGQPTTFVLDTDLSTVGPRRATIFGDRGIKDPVLSKQRHIYAVSEYMRKQDNGDWKAQAALRTCAVNMTYVDARVRCANGGEDCRVTHMRKSVKYSDRNPFMTPFDDGVVGTNMMKALPFATGVSNLVDFEPTSTERFLLGNGSLTSMFDVAEISEEEKEAAATAILNVPSKVFSTNLGIVLNTYYQLAIAPNAYMGNLPNASVFGPNGNSTYENGTVMENAPYIGVPVSATGISYERIYKCNFLWFALLQVSSIAMLVLGMASLVIKMLCLAPDMLGFVASMTYDNPYVRLPPGGSVLSAMERAQRLRRMEVGIVDVQKKESVGHVAFASLGGNRGNSFGELDKAKMYL